MKELKDFINETGVSKTNTIKGDIEFEQGDWIVTKRDTAGRGSQDKYHMYKKDGKEYMDYGTHPSLSGAKKFGKSRKFY